MSGVVVRMMDKSIGHFEAENPEYVAIRPFLRDRVTRHRK
jgi:hypothetical protein